MDERDYHRILKLVSPEYAPTVTIADLKDQADRTLLYGYDVNRRTWHTYVKDGELHHVIYDTRQLICYVHGELVAKKLPPNKRLYPECCDEEFCTLLITECGVELTFTNFDTKRPVADFYGLRHDQIETEEVEAADATLP